MVTFSKSFYRGVINVKIKEKRNKTTIYGGNRVQTIPLSQYYSI